MTTSRLRQKLVGIGEEISRQIEVLVGRPQLLRGYVYKLRRRCGKANCRCANGELHESWVVLMHEAGVRRMRAVPQNKVLRWRELAENYRRFRKARQELARLHCELMRLADLLEDGRVIVPFPNVDKKGEVDAGSDTV